MAAGDKAFEQKLLRLDQTSFSDEKRALVRAAADRGGEVCVSQVTQFMEQLSMDDDKVEVVTLLHARIHDPESAAALADAVRFSESKDRIRALFTP